jgi:hypothetical protein
VLKSQRTSRSFGAPRISRLLSSAGLALALGGIGTFDASAQTILINNGLAPPNAENVIDGSTAPDSLVLVRNLDCPSSGGFWYEPCPSPGPSTRVEIAAGADLAGGTIAPNDYETESSVWDSSIIEMTGGSAGGVSARGGGRVTMTGGTIHFLKAFDNSVVTLIDGDVASYLEAWGDATVSIRGGTVSNANGGVTTNSSVPVTVSGGSISRLSARQAGSYILEGSDFAVDGTPLPYGDYVDVAGTITGTWASGENFSVPTYGLDFLTLAPPATPAVPALPILPSLVLAAALLAIGAVQIGRRRAGSTVRGDVTEF